MNAEEKRPVEAEKQDRIIAGVDIIFDKLMAETLQFCRKFHFSSRDEASLALKLPSTLITAVETASLISSVPLRDLCGVAKMYGLMVRLDYIPFDSSKNDAAILFLGERAAEGIAHHIKAMIKGFYPDAAASFSDEEFDLALGSVVTYLRHPALEDIYARRLSLKLRMSELRRLFAKADMLPVYSFRFERDL